jgi:hypothetical protein
MTKKSNPYDPEYVMKRDNCSYDEALLTIQKFKNDKATNLKNFIKKYGEKEGTIKYNEWKNKTLAVGHRNSQKLGKSISRFSPSYYERKGYSPEVAIEMATTYQHENSPLHVEYYIKRGKTLDYARKKIRAIHDKKIGVDSYRKKLEAKGLTDREINTVIQKVRGHFSREVLGDEEFEKRALKIRQTMEKNGHWIPQEDLRDYEIYKREVYAVTKRQNLSLLKNYDKRARAGIEGGYQLDHKYSISMGYINQVPPSIIGSLSNLEFISWEENVSKKNKCSLSIEELMEEYTKNEN